MTKTLSKDKQLQNCLLALSLWSEVTPRSVNLDTWTCGSQACFGGHLATWPEFRAKGVIRNPHDGSPAMRNGASPAEHLFGNFRLFYVRDGNADGDAAFARRNNSSRSYKISDHRLVVERLQRQIVELSA